MICPFDWCGIFNCVYKDENNICDDPFIAMGNSDSYCSQSMKSLNDKIVVEMWGQCEEDGTSRITDTKPRDFKDIDCEAFPMSKKDLFSKVLPDRLIIIKLEG